MLRLNWALLVFAAMPLQAQDNGQFRFYQQLLTDGRNAIQLQNFDAASRYLEIARFGLIMDLEANAKQLKEIAILQVVVQNKLGNEQERFKYLTISARYMEESPGKPSGLEQSVWDEFLVISGRKAPPLPDDEAGLIALIRSEPDNLKAHIALIKVQVQNGERRAARQSIETALSRFPNDPDLLQTALSASVQVDTNNMENLARQVIEQIPDSSLANEILGNAAFRARDYQAAAQHYGYVGQPTLTQTAGNRRRTGEFLDQQKAAEQGEQTQKPQPEPANGQLKQASEDEGSGGNNRRRNVPRSRESTDRSNARNSGSTTAPPERVRRSNQPAPDPDGPSPAVLARREQERKQELRRQIDQLGAQVKAQPQNLPLHYQLASLYLDSEQTRPAGKLLRKLAARDSDSDAYKSFFARYQFARGKHSTNINTLARLAELPDQARFFLGKSYYALGQFDEAKAIWTPLSREVFPDLVAMDRSLAQR